MLVYLAYTVITKPTTSGQAFRYMDYEKPILGCVNAGNDLKQIINENEAGFIVNSGDHNLMSQVRKN